MMKTTAWKIPFVIAFVLLGAAFSAQAWAGQEWLFAHGTSGRVQNPSTVTQTVYGWGLEVTPNATSTWVHFAPPSRTLQVNSGIARQSKVRYLRLKFQTRSTDVRVTSIHVYDGNIRFKVIDMGFADGLYGEQDLLVDLGAAWKIYRGLGISLLVERGVESMDHAATFYAVGARWQY